MRTLEFEVKKQRLVKKMSCDFSGLVVGSVGYLQAKFYFSEEWDRCDIKIASFWLGEKEYAVRLDDRNCCEIRAEVLTGEEFGVSVIGGSSGYKITTNKINVRQEVR